MNKEFKKSSSGIITRYVLESDGGTTSASSMGSGSIPMPMGGVQRRQGDNLIAQEANKKVEPLKPRNFVAKNATTGGAGAHKDKKKAEKQGDVKHKKPFMEGAVKDLSADLRSMPDAEFVAKYKKSKAEAREAMKNVSEGEDHEIQMATSELMSIAKNAEALLDMVRKYSEEEGLDAWQQSKITKAADYLNAVLQAIRGEQSAMEDHSTATGGWGQDSYDAYSTARHGRGVAEAGMPSSVVKSKQKYSAMSDKDFHAAHKNKSEDDLKGMAWRHGYGKGSTHYVDKHKKGQEQGVGEAKADPTGSWVVYNGSKLTKFKTREGAKAYAEKNGGTVASSEYYHDKIQKKGVAEGLNEFVPDGFNGGDDETPGSWDDFIKAFDPEIRKMGFGMDKRSSHDARIYAHPKEEKGVMVRQHPEQDNVYFKLFHFFNKGEDKVGLADLSQNGAASVLVKIENFLNGQQGVAEGSDYMMELAAKLAEKIPKNAPVDVWIKDFEKSNAPQFRGKNLAKRKEMAIAASYGAKNPSKKK